MSPLLKEMSPSTAFWSQPMLTEILSTQWLVNGLLLQNLNLTNAKPAFSSVGNGVGILRLANLTQSYNLSA